MYLTIHSIYTVYKYTGPNVSEDFSIQDLSFSATLYFDLESAQVINAGQLEASYIIQDQLSRLTKQNKNAK